jgi:putative sterol carrier protein
VAEFLSDAWLADLSTAAEQVSVDPELQLVIQQVVLVGRGREAAYALRIAEGAVRVEPGRAEDADVTFTQDRATAAAIARGELGAQVAFLAGRVRLGGDPHRLLDASRELAALTDLFADVRATTTWVS